MFREKHFMVFLKINSEKNNITKTEGLLVASLVKKQISKTDKIFIGISQSQNATLLFIFFLYIYKARITPNFIEFLW